MARRLTAKRQITKERALAIIDQHIGFLQEGYNAGLDQGYDSSYDRHGLSVLRALREDLERRCEYGVFPSDD